MRKALIFLVPLFALGCTSNDDKPVRTYKGKTPKISVTLLERDVDQRLAGPIGDSIISSLGSQDMSGLSEDFKNLLKASGEPNQPWQGVAGASKRKELMTKLKETGDESRSMITGDQKTRRIEEGAQSAAHRLSAHLMLARIYSENGDSKMAADTAIEAIDWCNKILFDSKSCQLLQSLHPLKERTLKAVGMICDQASTKPEDKARIAEAVSKMNSMRMCLQEAISRSFSNDLLLPNFNVTALRSGKNVFQFATRGDVDIKIANAFADAVLDNHPAIFEPHETAKIGSDYVVGMVESLTKSWPEAKMAMMVNEKKATEVWGFDPFKMTESMFKDKDLQKKTKEKIANVKSPNGYLQVQFRSEDYRNAIPAIFVLDVKDSVLIAKVMKSCGTLNLLPKDPLTGQGFAVSGSSFKSTYAPLADDPGAIKSAATASYAF